MYTIKTLVVRLILLFVVMGFPSSGFSQEDNPEQQLPIDNAAREEIQRYFGYEDLFFRYATLPYDVSAGVNQKGRFVDIGYALLALLPLMLMALFYKKKRWFYGLMFFFTIYLMTCFQFSYIQDNLMGRYNPIAGEVSSDPLNDGFTQGLLEPVYAISGYVSRPITAFIGNFTGPKDHITYPFLFFIFLVAIYALLSNRQSSHKQKFFAIIAMLFSFFWWLFCGGIIWYGYLMIPLGYAFIVFVISSGKEYDTSKIVKVIRNMGLGTLSAWLVLAGVARVSNLSGLNDMNNLNTGKSIVESRIFPYSVGVHTERESMDGLAKNINTALDKINSDSSIVVHFGSGLIFDIKQNNLRAFEDNQLSYFYSIVERYRTRAKIVEYYKSVGVKYLIIDLRMITIDRTPEKSLTKKFNILRNGFIKDNSAIRLVATDQEVIISQAGGSESREFGLFGDKYPNFGSYAVFEIL